MLVEPERPSPRAKYALRHTSSEMKAMVKEIRYKLDISTLHRNEEDKDIKMNDILSRVASYN